MPSQGSPEVARPTCKKSMMKAIAIIDNDHTLPLINSVKWYKCLHQKHIPRYLILEAMADEGVRQVDMIHILYL